MSVESPVSRILAITSAQWSFPSRGGAERLKIELNRDGFMARQPIVLDKRLGRIAFTLENRTGDAHETEISLHLPYGSHYELLHDGEPAEMVPTDDRDHPWRAVVPVGATPTRLELVRADRP